MFLKKVKASIPLASLVFAASVGLTPSTAAAQVTGVCLIGCPAPGGPTQTMGVWTNLQAATASQAGAEGTGTPVRNRTRAMGRSDFDLRLNAAGTAVPPGTIGCTDCGSNRIGLTLTGSQRLSAGAQSVYESRTGPAHASAVTGLQGAVNYTAVFGPLVVTPVAPAAAKVVP